MRDERLRTLELLRLELDILEDGGDDSTPSWPPFSMFLDSPSRWKPDDALALAPSAQSWLLVPQQFRQECGPGHLKALNNEGELIARMSRRYSAVEVEEALRAWLKAEIGRLELADKHPEIATFGAN